MDLDNYYTLLGIEPHADTQTIHQAYRKLARQYHPDVNPGKRDAEEGFKKINEAYRVLSDLEQRRQYDSGQYSLPRPQPGDGQAFDWRRWSARTGDPSESTAAVSEALEERPSAEGALAGGFIMIFGQAGEPASDARRGQDVEHKMDLTLEEAFRGMTCLVQVRERQVQTEIPPGVQTGARLCLPGLGQPGYRNGPPGDLYLVLNVLPHPCFVREGDDLYTTIAIDMYMAVLGGEVRLPGLDQPLTITLPARTHEDCIFRVTGRGMPRLSAPGQRGHLYVRIKLALPDPLSEYEVSTLRELAMTRQRRQAGTPAGM